MPIEGKLYTRDRFPETTPLTAREISSDLPEISQNTRETLQRSLDSANRRVEILSVHEALAREELNPKLRRALEFSGSIIVDYGGIGNLVDAIQYDDQAFSTIDVAQALKEQGFIADSGDYLKMGTSGAVLSEGRGAEVIEAQLLKQGEVVQLAKAAAKNKEGNIGVNRLLDPTRVLLENEFLIRRNSPELERVTLITMEFKENSEENLISLIDRAAQEAGLVHYTVRATIIGPVNADMAVISGLPEKPLLKAAEIGQLLVVSSQESSDPRNIFHFVGSRSNAATRVNARWGELTGSEIYPGKTAGHYHGYSEDGKMGGHIRNLKPQAGSRVEIILEPARVVSVTNK